MMGMLSVPWNSPGRNLKARPDAIPFDHYISVTCDYVFGRSELASVKTESDKYYMYGSRG